MRFPGSRNRALIAALLLFGGLACGHAQDGRGPVELEADQAKLNNAKGVSTYIGNVVLTRGELRLTGDRMEVYVTDARNLERVIVTGDPATYRDVPPDDGQPIDAEAPRMEYYVSGPERIRLLQGASVTQGRNRFQGDTIVYQPKTDRIDANSSGQDDRIRIKLYPESEQGGGE